MELLIFVALLLFVFGGLPLLIPYIFKWCSEGIGVNLRRVIEQLKTVGISTIKNASSFLLTHITQCIQTITSLDSKDFSLVIIAALMHAFLAAISLPYGYSVAKGLERSLNDRDAWIYFIPPFFFIPITLAVLATIAFILPTTGSILTSAIYCKRYRSVLKSIQQIPIAISAPIFMSTSLIFIGIGTSGDFSYPSFQWLEWNKADVVRGQTTIQKAGLISSFISAYFCGYLLRNSGEFRSFGNNR